MLGGSETFVKGGWEKHTAMLDLLPVKLDGTGTTRDFSTGECGPNGRKRE